MAVRDKVLEAAAELVPDRGARGARRRRDASAASTISRTGSRHQGADDPAVPRGHRPGPAGVRRRAARRRRRGRARRPRAARRRRAGGDRGRPTTRSTPRSSAWPSGWTRSPQRCASDLERRGVLEAVRSDIARGKALEFLDRPRERRRRGRQRDRSHASRAEPTPNDATIREPTDERQPRSNRRSTQQRSPRREQPIRNYLRPRRSSSRRHRGERDRTTSTRACSRTASSSWARRSTTPSPT